MFEVEAKLLKVLHDAANVNWQQIQSISFIWASTEIHLIPSVIVSNFII